MKTKPRMCCSCGLNPLPEEVTRKKLPCPKCGKDYPQSNTMWDNSRRY